jgi:TonB family protein
VFLASGSVGHRERRAPAATDARDGAPEHHAREAALASSQHQAGELVAAPPPVHTQAASAARAARGIMLGTGARPSLAARVAHARPNVDRGPSATPAEVLEPKVHDDIDAELLAATLQRSIVDSSTQRAAREAAGFGGVADPAQTGLSSRGQGTGSRALPYLPGPGEGSALDTSDARYVRWFTDQRKRVQDELIFPRPRALAKDQGISIYRIVVRRDGRLSGSPHLVRSSGYADFDEAAVVAIQRAVPFSPLPARLLPDSSDVTVLIPIAFSNPMVQ